MRRLRKKPIVAIIGAGRLGTALGRALKEAGYRIELVVAQREPSARRAARLIGEDTVWLTEPQLARQKPGQFDRTTRSSLILISTPDDAIAPVAEQLAALFNSGASRSRLSRVAMHTSGALSSEVLAPLRRAGFATGSLHPLASISDPLSGSKAFRKVFFAVEGLKPAVSVARSVVRDLGGHSFSIDPNKKALYHAAAVTASGHVVALFDIALEMLVRCGLSPRRARQVLMPLLESTMTNLSTRDPSDALTGTFARGDLTTAQRHFAAIVSQNLRDALTAYVVLGRRSLALAKDRSSVNDAGWTKLLRLAGEQASLDQEGDRR